MLEQAQKGEMQQQLSEMAEKLNQLKVDNSKITQRNSTLEQVLVIKESEITELQDQSKVRASFKSLSQFVRLDACLLPNITSPCCAHAKACNSVT